MDRHEQSPGVEVEITLSEMIHNSLIEYFQKKVEVLKIPAAKVVFSDYKEQLQFFGNPLHSAHDLFQPNKVAMWRSFTGNGSDKKLQFQKMEWSDGIGTIRTRFWNRRMDHEILEPHYLDERIRGLFAMEREFIPEPVPELENYGILVPHDIEVPFNILNLSEFPDWNIVSEHFRNPIDLLKFKVQGINVPSAYISIGSQYLGVHQDDYLFPSVDFSVPVYSGIYSAKTWIVIDKKNRKELMAELFKKFGTKCENLLIRENLFLSPEWLSAKQIPYIIINQFPGQIVMIKSGSIYGSVTHGLNVNVAVNFCSNHWFKKKGPKDCLYAPCETRNGMCAYQFFGLTPARKKKFRKDFEEEFPELV